MPFPSTQAETNALLQIWLVKLPNWATLYGLSNETVKQVQDDAVMYKHLIDAILQLDSDKDELMAYRDNIVNGNPKATAADYPEVVIKPLPAFNIVIKPGINIRNRELYNFLKAHPNRTTESLADLGIVTTTPPKIATADLRPSLKISAKINDRTEISFVNKDKPRFVSKCVAVRQIGQPSATRPAARLSTTRQASPTTPKNANIAAFICKRMKQSGSSAI